MRLATLCGIGALVIAVQNRDPVRVSDDRSDAVAGSACLAGRPAGTLNENEAYAATDPTRPGHMVVAWQGQSGGRSLVQWARSVDSGRTWSAPRVVPINACAGGPVPGAQRASDPWVAFGPDGRLYLSAIAWEPSANDEDSISALVVVASPDGGNTWNAPVAAAVAPRRVAHDNLAITADPKRPATLYLATTRAETPDSATYFGRLGFSRSDDGGRTWTPIRPINPAVNRERIGAPQIVADPRGGRIYAVFHRRGPGQSYVGVMTSSDRGESWSDMVSAVPHVRGTPLTHPTTSRRFVAADDIVQAVVSPRNGRLVIAYADASAASGARFGISAVVSANGREWSAPQRVSASTQAWLPAIAATARGEIAISYFSSGFGAAPDSSDMELVRHRYSLSGDRLTQVDRAVLDRFPLFWPGDYQGLVATGDRYTAAYGRGGDIFVASSP